MDGPVYRPRRGFASSGGGWVLDVGGRDACDTSGSRIHLEKVSEGDI